MAAIANASVLQAPTCALGGIRCQSSRTALPSSLSSNSASLHALRAPALSAQPAAFRKTGLTVCKVSVGDAAPEVVLPDQNGRTFKLSSLKGKNVVLYFYPKDETPGCTKQACSFRDSFADFRSLGAEVVGISSDSPESHAAFAEKFGLPYRLLSDEDNEVRKEWGVPADLFGFLPGRQTYVLDKKGVVQLVFNNQFQPEKHIAETISLLEELKGAEPKFSFPKLF